jgi:hypothetical protein
MCFYTQQHASIKDVTKRFNAAVDDPDGFGCRNDQWVCI